MKLEELSRLLRQVDPGAVLLPREALARVVQNVTGVAWAVWYVPHSHCLAIDRATLFRHVEQEELHVPSDHLLPEAVLLLERPTADQLAAPRGDNSELLARYWRLLFHASVHREVDRRLAASTPAQLRERVERIGPVAFEEARNVLIQDGLLADGASDAAAYAEFAAFFLELRYFAGNLIPVYFPSLPPVPEVEAVLAADVDGAELFRRTRLPGAPDPAPKTDDQSDESQDFYLRLTQAAQRAARAADTVGAAILHTRAARVAPAHLTRPALGRAGNAIYDLIARLQSVLGLTDPAVQSRWREVLPTLLDKADQGARPVEAALLYDLQRACQDFEQTIYTLDVFEWALSRGRRPIKRPLDSQRFVRVPDHLRNAIRRLAAARLTDADRQALGGLLRDALDRAEERLRHRFRPVLTEALRDAGLEPTSPPERAALAKTVEELLDRISSVGFLTFADVRDAIARGQLKLADLSGPHEYVRGDPLLRLDRRLDRLLDGVYRRGESYTRGLERLTSLAFGTRTGRWFTRNLLLPFGGAAVGGQFVWLLSYERRRLEALSAGQAGPSYFGGWNAAWEFHAIWLAFGLIVLAAINSAAFRASLIATARAGYHALRAVFWYLPIRVWNNPLVRAMAASVPAQMVLNYAVKPLAVCAVLLAGFPDLWNASPVVQLVIVAVVVLVVNSRLGRLADILFLELARKLIDLIGSAPAVVRWINDVFRDLLDALEWVLARVEDWLRIRGTSGPLAMAIRVVAGVIWMPFAFLTRFYTVVLIEPMINPLKLPLSLLFAKFVYPLLAVIGLFTLDPLGSPLVERLAPVLTYPVAWAVVIGTFWLSPDAVTYLFWEMRENWRLYRANHPDALGVVPVGPHGERVKALLHLGIHSGTVPRLYRRLRAAEVEGGRTGEWQDARTYRQALRTVEESVLRFVTRDLVVVVNSASAWDGPPLAVGAVSLGTNRIRVQLTREGEAEPAWFEWEDRSGWLVALCAQAGFLATLPPGPARVFENTLAYLYKRAGVDMVQEQIRADLPKEAVHFDFAPGGLLVWYGSRESSPVLYDPTDPGEELRPRNPVDGHLIHGPTLEADRLIFSRLTLTWGLWLAVWEPRPPGEPQPRFGPTDWELILLPPRPAPRNGEANAPAPSDGSSSS
jgi:hypothetical protein